MIEWICLDCTAECMNSHHSWVRAERITRDDGSDAWVVCIARDLDMDPNDDTATDSWFALTPKATDDIPQRLEANPDRDADAAERGPVPAHTLP